MTTRRQSVSDLNLEEILLAMADTEHQPETKPQVMRTGSRPLPTPRSKNKNKLEKSPRPLSMPVQNEYFYEQYLPQDSPYYQPIVTPDTNELLPRGYSSNQYYEHNNMQYNNNYNYNYNNNAYYRHSMYENMNYNNMNYNYNNDYYYNYESSPVYYTEPTQYNGEYYMEGYPYYPVESGYEYDYNYLTEPGYENQYYQPSPAIYSQSNPVTPSRPLPRLPRLPSKKNKNKNNINNKLGHDLTFGTPPIASSHHLGLFPHQNSETETMKAWMDSPLTEQESMDANEEEENILDLEEAESQENLDALLADITLKVSQENNMVSKSKTIHTSSVLDNENNNFNQLRQDSMPSNTSSLSSPLPPPRLTKEIASKRLSESYQRSPKPFLTLNQHTKDFTPNVSSPLSVRNSVKNPILKVKESVKINNNTNNKLFKRNTSKLNPNNKINNCIQIVSSSSPVIDKEADGFDFDESDFEPIDNKIKLIKYETEWTLEQLVNEHIIINLKYDWQKIRAIFCFIAENITYDYTDISELDHSDSEDEEDSDKEEDYEYLETAKAVLTRGSCKQMGFANLFKAMIQAADLECEIIEGVLKDPNNPYDLDKEPKVNHAWNSVKIQGYYRLIDCGLASATHQYNLNRKTDYFYFLTNPSKMIFTHYPIKNQYQYLLPPINYSIFNLLPFATSLFFDNGIKILNLPEGLIHVNEDETYEINLLIPEELKCYAEVETYENNDNILKLSKKYMPLVQCKSRENGRLCKIMIRIKGKDNRALLKFRCGYINEQNKILNYCFSLRLSHEGNKQPEEFVKLLPSKKEFFLIEPINFDLLYNINYRFHILPSVMESTHFKLALRSPSMKIHKFVYYPGDQGYVANVTLRERGQWAISYMVQSKQERSSKRDPWINVACYRCI